ncbi:HAMP domain-containing histidine kinase [bacterium]|nr:HAMP domain-containing histidine kinase [bacterium]
MKKIVRQQNYFKELIDSQDNRYLSRQTLKCLLRSALEPLLDEPESGVVFYRIDDKDGLKGLLKRLEYSEIESYNYSDNSENLLEKVWSNTEFFIVMTHRYVSIFIWDNNTGDKNTVRYYSLYNSKLQSEPLDILKRNSNIDISSYIEKYNPDRRDNILLNASIRRLLSNLDEAKDDAVLGYAEKNADALKEVDYVSRKNRIVSHEIRNQLSICDMYSEIIKRYSECGNNEGIQRALNSIDKALKMTNNLLLTLKSDENTMLENLSLKEIIDNALELSSAYLDGKDIELYVELTEGITIVADFDKLVSVIINLVKNATEAFGNEEIIDENVKNGKYIKIKTEIEEKKVCIEISNNAPGIQNPERIFNEGYTTKNRGSGLGLWICKKSIEEQGGTLELTRTTEDFTEFTIRLDLGG